MPFNKIRIDKGVYNFIRSINLHSFWLFNITGCVIFITIDGLLLILQIEKLTPQEFLSNSIAWIAVFATTPGLRYIYKKYLYRTKPILSTIFYIFLFSLLASIIGYVVAHIVYYYTHTLDFLKFMSMVFSPDFIIYKQAQLIPLFVSWSVLYFGIKLWLDLTEEQERAEKASLMARSSQLEMLRYQLNPHFLFNTLSSLRALVTVNPQKAEMMITKISEFLRYSLIDSENEEVPLKREVEIIQLYLDIEKVRFGNGLIAEFEIDHAAEDYPIPIFLIHPLVENAVKYGMKTSEDVLRILVSAHVNNQELRVSVLNSGKWVEKDSALAGSGKGLENIRKRLAISCPGNHKIDIIKNPDSVVIELSLQKDIRNYKYGTEI